MANQSGSGGGEISLNTKPIAHIVSGDQRAVLGAIVRLDARASFDADEQDLTYHWSVTDTPIGSQIDSNSFLAVLDDLSAVSITPDVTGSYEIQLRVHDGVEFSDPVRIVVNILRTLVPVGLVPDLSYLWRVLPDFYSRVEGKKKIEMIWQAVFQVLAGDLLTLYQYDYNKSISTIQELRQRKWVAYEPYLPLTPAYTSFVLTESQSGVLGSTELLDAELLTVLPSTGYMGAARVPLTEGRFDVAPSGMALLPGKLLVFSGMCQPIVSSATSRSSLVSGEDGATTAASTLFQGSDFDASILDGTLVAKMAAGTRMATVTGVPSGLTVATSATWSTTESALAYSVLSKAATHAVAYLRQSILPAGLRQAPWWLASVLASVEVDFEKAGVSAGDFLEVEVIRTDTSRSSTIRCAIVGVWGGQLAFTLSDAPVAGVADGLPTNSIAALAAELEVPGLLEDVLGAPVYTDVARAARDVVSSYAFKKAYFEKKLTSDDTLNVGPFEITIRPKGVYRTRKIAINPAIVSVPALREWINPVDVTGAIGALSMITPLGDQVSIARIPVNLFENHDYVIDDESVFTLVGTITVGSPLVVFPKGRLLGRSLEPGDVLTSGLGSTAYTLQEITSDDSARVTPTPTVSATTNCTFFRRQAGRFIRFVPGTFSASSLPPQKMWAEFTYLDNTDIVEANFGTMTGLLREELTRRGAGIPYLSAVSGLMYFLTSGRSVEDGRLAAQVLFGLPFSRVDGVIKQIDPACRRRIDGSPEFGRIVVSEVVQNELTGRNFVYLYPQGPQVVDQITGEWVSPFPGSAGIATSPLTNRLYEVGDVVFRYDPLSKGVTYGDHLTEDGAKFLASYSLVERYHSFVLAVNMDLVRDVDIDLAADILVRERAMHTKIVPAGSVFREDSVTSDDDVTFEVQVPLFDNVSLGLPTALKVDRDDFNDSYLRSDGYVVRRLMAGTDLSLPAQGLGDDLVISQHLLTNNVAAGLAFESPRIVPGDILTVRSSPNEGSAAITSVTGDTTFLVESDGYTDTDNVEYTVDRAIQNPLWSGPAEIVKGQDYITLGADGALGAGAGPGDVLVFATPEGPASRYYPSRPYTITGVYSLGNTRLIYLKVGVVENSGTYTTAIVRKGLLCKTKLGPSSPDLSVLANEVLGARSVNLSASTALKALELAMLSPKDSLLIDGDVYALVHHDTSTGDAVVLPTLRALYKDVPATVERFGKGDTPVSLDTLDTIPESSVEITLSPEGNDRLTYTSGNATVTALYDLQDLGVKTHDFVQFLEGAGALEDIGYGAGIFPVRNLIAGSPYQLSLCLPMTHSSAAGGYLYSIIRRVQNA